jgi:hypothetical protein
VERRKHRRVPIQIQGLLLGNSHEVEGHTLDLSVFPGKTIVVRLVIPGLEEPLSIPEATVQWVDEQTFGVEFQEIPPDELDDLEDLINEFDETEDSGHA